MFEGLRGKTQGVIDEDYREKYNESVEATEDNEDENNSNYQIRIKIKGGKETVMFEGLRSKTQCVINEDYREDYNKSVEATEGNEDEGDSDFQICIEVKGDNEYYVDDCKENWEVLKNLNNETSCFIYLKDSSERDDGILGIRVSEIIAFYSEED